MKTTLPGYRVEFAVKYLDSADDSAILASSSCLLFMKILKPKIQPFDIWLLRSNRKFSILVTSRFLANKLREYSVTWRQLSSTATCQHSHKSIALTKGERSKCYLFYSLRWSIYTFNSVVNTKLPAILINHLLKIVMKKLREIRC